MTTLDTDVLIIGSGAGGATTAARLAEAGRDVLIAEEGAWVAPEDTVPFSLGEMVAKYRHHGGAAALGSPAIAYAEGSCVGGSTEVNSGLWHRLPEGLADQWRRTYSIAEFTTPTLEHYASEMEAVLGVSTFPGPPPISSAILADGATKLGWRSAEFPRVFRYGTDGTGIKQTMSRTLLPRATAAGAVIQPRCRIKRLTIAGGRVTGASAELTHDDGSTEAVQLRAEHVFVCGGAIQTPALLQRSGVRRHIGQTLKLHPTIKIAARFPFELDHDDVPMHRIVEFAPGLTIGGSTSRRGHVALALAEAGAPYQEALDDWESVGVYYTAIRSEGSGRVVALPGFRAPLVTYRLTPGDLSRLARGLVHLGEALLAAGATELYPSVVDGSVVRDVAGLGQWWDQVTPARTNLMTIHLTSSIRIGEDADLAGADSFGRIRGVANLRVNDASLLPDAPGVNPQAAIMTLAARNADHFLGTT